MGRQLARVGPRDAATPRLHCRPPFIPAGSQPRDTLLLRWSFPRRWPFPHGTRWNLCARPLVRRPVGSPSATSCWDTGGPRARSGAALRLRPDPGCALAGFDDSALIKRRQDSAREDPGQRLADVRHHPVHQLRRRAARRNPTPMPSQDRTVRFAGSARGGVQLARSTKARPLRRWSRQCRARRRIALAALRPPQLAPRCDNDKRCRLHGARTEG